MNRSVILSLLRQGNNGNEILQILDTLVADVESDCEEAEIEFWLIVTGEGVELYLVPSPFVYSMWKMC